MANFDEILAVAKDPGYTRVATARILLRQDLDALHEELDERLMVEGALDLKQNRAPQAPAIAAQIVALEAEIEEAKVPFKFRSIGYQAWMKLLGAHAPTRKQLADNASTPFNPETFPAAAIAASCIDPVMTVEQVNQLFEVVGKSEIDLLFSKCVDANVGGTSSPKSLAAGRIHRLNAERGLSAASTESPEASSSDE